MSYKAAQKIILWWSYVGVNDIKYCVCFSDMVRCLGGNGYHSKWILLCCCEMSLVLYGEFQVWYIQTSWQISTESNTS